MEQTYIRSTTVPLMIPDYVNPPQSYADTATSSTIEWQASSQANRTTV
jgi:hypothetical protein